MVTAFQYKSKVEISYDYILEKIMALQLKAGDRLVISQIAKECGVSDIPVREALRMLQREGYVTIEANRGAVINGVSDEAVRNMIMIKGVLEAYATRLSADYLTEEDLEELRDINRELWKMAEENDVAGFQYHNLDFHSRIYRNLPNQELIDMINDLRHRWGITRSVFQIAPERMRESSAEHDRIIELLAQKDYDELERFTRIHKFAGSARYHHNDK